MRKEGIFKFENGSFKLDGYELLSDFPHLLINPKIDFSSFKQQIKYIESLEEDNLHYHVNINLDTITKYKDEIINIINKSKAKEKIVIEILEEYMLEKDMDILINSFAENGINISIDDFGTKASNFDRLLKYKTVIESVKIDRVLWKSMPYVVKAIVEESQMKVIAKKVETQEEINMLSNLGVSFFQGWYFKDNFESFIKQSIAIETNSFEEEVMLYILKQTLKIFKEKYHNNNSIDFFLDLFKAVYFGYKLNVPLNSNEFEKILKDIVNKKENFKGQNISIDDAVRKEIKNINYVIGELKVLDETLKDNFKKLRENLYKNNIEEAEMYLESIDKILKNTEKDLSDKILEMKMLISDINQREVDTLPRQSFKKAIQNMYLSMKNSNKQYSIFIIYIPTLREIYETLSYNLYSEALEKLSMFFSRNLPSDAIKINYDIDTFLIITESKNPEDFSKKLSNSLKKVEILLNKKFYDFENKISHYTPNKNSQFEDVLLNTEAVIYEMKNF